MITKEEAYQKALEFFPELANRTWVIVVDGLPPTATVFETDNYPIGIDYWLVQYSKWRKDEDECGIASSYGIWVCKESGKILYQDFLSDEGK